jgi:hypothetical protein
MRPEQQVAVEVPIYSFGFAALQAPWRTEPQPDERRARSQAALAGAPQELPERRTPGSAA